VASPTDELLGSHCLEYINPDFRQKVREGHDIVVAGKAFGCGSSREEAPRALKGLGVKCVIARSFSFIYGRNQPNIALLGIIINDDDFYARVTPGVDIEVILNRRVVVVDVKHEYSFELDEVELRLIERRGLAKAFLEFGGQVFQSLCGEAPEPSRPEKWAERVVEGEREEGRNQLAW
jgi:3-isopropylmalate dehydratase small subunit